MALTHMMTDPGILNKILRLIFFFMCLLWGDQVSEEKLRKDSRIILSPEPGEVPSLSSLSHLICFVAGLWVGRWGVEVGQKNWK